MLVCFLLTYLAIICYVALQSLGGPDAVYPFVQQFLRIHLHIIRGNAGMRLHAFPA